MRQRRGALAALYSAGFALLLSLTLSGPAPAGASTISKDSHARDDELQSFMQKRFLIPVAGRIRFSAPAPAPFHGLTMRLLTVTNDQLRDTTFTVLTAPHSPKLIIGQLLGVDDSIADPAQRLLKALNSKFSIPAGTQVSLGSPQPAPLGKMVVRSVTIMGRLGHISVYSNEAATQAVAGEVMDLSSDPWDRADLSTLHLTDRPTLGPPDAPVTIVEFGDFECPYCAHAINTVENCVTNTYNGRVRLIFKNYPLRQHTWAQAAAIAGNCVFQQNPTAFWDYVHDIYRDQSSITPQNLSQHVDEFAQDHQLDGQVLHACMMSNAAEDRVAQDIADGQRVNVTSTPTFYVNGVPVVGDRDADTFDFVIDSMLGSKTATR